MSAPAERELPKLILVGCGLGSLMLALLLERIGIDYCILERATTHKPLGNSLSYSQFFSVEWFTLPLFSVCVN